jgi:hypothetical protein
MPSLMLIPRIEKEKEKATHGYKENFSVNPKS